MKFFKGLGLIFLEEVTKAVFTLAKSSAVMPATVTSDSSWAMRHKILDRIVSIFCRVAQGSQGKYSQLSLSLMVTLMNAANVNGP